MRTTIDIEDDLLKTLRDRAHQMRQPFKKTVNAILRKGLDEETKTVRKKRFKCPVFSLGDPAQWGYDLDKALAVAEAMEDTEIARKTELRK